MVNTRAKSRKIQNIHRICFSQASITDLEGLSTQSGALIGSNDELLTEILRRLPVTSVLRFKSVSKHWRSLLSQRHFTLLYDKVMSDQAYERALKYYVFNPTTKQFAIIPSVPGGMDICKTIRFMGLASHNAGSGHYKVVCIRREIQIYSSDTQKWRISNESFSAPYYTSFNCGVYLNGAVYWAPTCLDLLYFNLDVEKLQKLPSPVRLASLLYFGESRDHLHIVGTANHENFLHLNVYEMSSDHSGWFIKYQLELDELPVAYPEMICSYQHPSSRSYYVFIVLDVVRGELEEDTFMVVWIPGKIIRYNVVDKSFKQIFDLTNVLFGSQFLAAHLYTEALTFF